LIVVIPNNQAPAAIKCDIRAVLIHHYLSADTLAGVDHIAGRVDRDRGKPITALGKPCIRPYHNKLLPAKRNRGI
jgi:hypothetical protein